MGSKGDQYKMIGNAVPPLFSKIIAEVVHELLIGKMTEKQGLFKLESELIN